MERCLTNIDCSLMQKNKEKILCISMADWDHEYKGVYHHIPYILTDSHEVVYVEKVRHINEISSVGLARFFRFLSPTKKIKPNLLVITPPPAIPLLDKLPLLNHINDWIFMWFIKLKLKKMDFKPTILWLFSYFAYFTIGKFKEQISLYYCGDPFHLHESKHNIKKEKLLCQRTDIIITPGIKLTEEKKSFNTNAFTVLHGVDIATFCKAPGNLPEDIKNIKKPIIGYAGLIKSDLDLELIKYIVEKRPDWSIVLIGGLIFGSASEKKQWQELTNRYNNIYLLGQKEIHEVPVYLQAIDVTILPYDVNNKENAWCTLPLKFFECLVMGKPIVSSGFANFHGIPQKYYEIGHNYADFVQKIENSLKNDSPEKQQERIEYAKNNSFQKRIEQMLEYINTIRLKKRPEK